MPAVLSRADARCRLSLFVARPYAYLLTMSYVPQELGKLGYKYQFVTLAGFHSLNHGMFTLSKGYAARGMAAYSELQQAEFASEKDGYTATRCVPQISSDNCQINQSQL
jgi:isocitrate lyase